MSREGSPNPPFGAPEIDVPEAAEGFASIEAEYEYLIGLQRKIESERMEPRHWNRRGQLNRQHGQVVARITELKPFVKSIRRSRRGEEDGQRTRHDVMEDMLVELRVIRGLLETK